MTNSTSAVIIPFPAPRLSTPFYGPADALPTADRLSTALDSLTIALGEQHRAMQRWREALAELATSMNSLSSAPRPSRPVETNAS